MKASNTLLFCFFALLCVCFAAPNPKPKVDKTNDRSDPDNFRMANQAAEKANVDLEHNGFYIFLEKWQSHNSAEECASGFSHVRLVVGEYLNKGARKTLDAYAYDLVKEQNTPTLQKIYGGPWDHNVEEFWADHYFKPKDDKVHDDKDGWVRVSKPNSYVYGGRVKPGVIKEGNRLAKARNDVQEYLIAQCE